jgi:predicted transcriptional regulator
MEVHFTPEVQAKLDQMARESECPSEQVVESAVKCYLDGLERVREILDSRYDDLESGRVKPIDGEAFFESLRAREDELLKKRALG